MYLKLAVFVSLALSASALMRPKRGSVLQAITNNMTAIGQNIANIKANTSVDTVNGIKAWIKERGRANGNGLSKLDAEGYTIVAHQNGTVLGGTTMSNITANGTVSEVNNAINQTLTGNESETSIDQDGTAAGADIATVDGEMENTIVQANPVLPLPFNYRNLIGSGASKADNVLASLMQKQQVNENNASSQLNAVAEGNGATKSISGVLGTLIKNDGKYIIADGTGFSEGDTVASAAGAYILDEEENQVTTKQEGFATAQGIAGGAGNSNVLLSGNVDNGTHHAYVNGDAQGNGAQSAAQGDVQAGVDSNGAFGYGDNIATADGADQIDAVATNNIQAQDSDGNSIVVGGGQMTGNGTNANGHVGAGSTTLFQTGGGPVGYGQAVGEVMSDNDKTNMSFNTHGTVDTPSTHHSGETGGEGVAKGEYSNLSGDTFVLVGDNYEYADLTFVAKANGANTSNLNTKTHMNGTFDGSTFGMAGESDMAATGDDTDISSTIQQSFNNGTGGATVNTTGEASSATGNNASLSSNSMLEFKK